MNMFVCPLNDRSLFSPSFSLSLSLSLFFSFFLFPPFFFSLFSPFPFSSCFFLGWVPQLYQIRQNADHPRRRMRSLSVDVDPHGGGRLRLTFGMGDGLDGVGHVLVQAHRSRPIPRRVADALHISHEEQPPRVGVAREGVLRFAVSVDVSLDVLNGSSGLPGLPTGVIYLDVQRGIASVEAGATPVGIQCRAAYRAWGAVAGRRVGGRALPPFHGHLDLAWPHLNSHRHQFGSWRRAGASDL
mmetsp:Transcript_35487/g.88198  ORF Transcript_35487/g.88198 Transcript_35487/m.88198 type:complete len:242 (-) Transcript_35487:63-788(-)